MIDNSSYEPGISPVTMNILTWSRICICCIWLVFNFIVIASFVAFRRLRHMSTRLIFWLLMALFLENVAHMLSVVNLRGPEGSLASDLCYVQAGLLQFSQTAQLGWITIIALNLYIVVSSGESPDQWEVMYHFVVWFVASVLTVIPIAYTSYGYTALWCWITDDWATYFQVYVFYCPLLVVIVSISLLYILIWRAVTYRIGVYAEWSINQNQKLTALTKRLIVYPLLLVFYLFPLIIHLVVKPEQKFFALYALRAILVPMLGILTVIVYGMDKELRRTWHLMFTKNGCYCQLLSVVCGVDGKRETYVSTQENIFFELPSERSSLVNSVPKSYRTKS